MADKWPYVKRTLHLIGGLRAICEAGEARLYVLPQAKEGVLEASLSNYASLFNIVCQMELDCVGAEFVSHIEEAKGAIPPEWRPWFLSEGWLCFENRQTWAEISHSAQKKDNFQCADNARRIKSEIDTCQYHLLRLSKAYSQCLFALVNSNTFKANQPFDNMFSQDIFDSIHSFFSSIGTLRDYLAEYIGEFIILDIPPKIKNQKKMAKLIQELKKESHSGNPLQKYLLEITSRHVPYGWLAVLNEYRNIVIHQSPITDMLKRRYLWQQTMSVEGATLPIILFPIPEDPISISAERRRSDFYNQAENKSWHAFESEMNPAEPDALLYCHQCLGNMMELSKKVIELSPCRPEPIVITPKGGILRRFS